MATKAEHVTIIKDIPDVNRILRMMKNGIENRKKKQIKFGSQLRDWRRFACKAGVQCGRIPSMPNQCPTSQDWGWSELLRRAHSSQPSGRVPYLSPPVNTSSETLRDISSQTRRKRPLDFNKRKWKIWRKGELCHINNLKLLVDGCVTFLHTAMNYWIH